MLDGTFVCSELGYGTMDCTGERGFGGMYVEWYGVCDVSSVVEVFDDDGGMHVFHVCFVVVDGVGISVNICDVVCFLRLGVVM